MAKNIVKETPPPSKKDEINNRMVTPAMVRVRVGAQHINEDGVRAPGSEFETTDERASALGGLVTRI